MTRRIGVLGLLIAVALLVGACQSRSGAASGALPLATTPNPSTGPTRPTVRDNGAGGVTVEATWLGNQEDGGLTFRLKFDTHSVDLSTFNVVENVLLRDDAGRELRAGDWRDERRDSHHRAGTVRFPALPPGGDRSRLTLVIRNLAGVAERALTFEFRQ